MRVTLVSCVLASCLLAGSLTGSSARAGHGHCRGAYSPGATYAPRATYAPGATYAPAATYYAPSYYTPAPTYYAPAYYAPVATYAAPTYYVPAATYAPSYAPAYAPGAPSSTTCAGQGPGGPSPPSAGTPSFLAAIADFRAVLQLLQEFNRGGGGGGGGDGQIGARLTAIESEIAELKRDVQVLKAGATKGVPPIPKTKE